MTRAEHLDYCKKRAFALCDAGDLRQAFTSIASDLDKHPETKGHTAVHLGMLLLMNGHLSTQKEMREFIDGFH